MNPKFAVTALGAFVLGCSAYTYQNYIAVKQFLEQQDLPRIYAQQFNAKQSTINRVCEGLKEDTFGDVRTEFCKILLEANWEQFMQEAARKEQRKDGE